MARSVVVFATSDRPALVRVRACFVALAIAEYFRDRGEDVLLVMDSITRLAMAQHEIGLAADSSITGFFTVQVEGDDSNEPVPDAVRGIATRTARA